MAFETNLVAIRWHAGKYDVVSSSIGHIDTDVLRADGRLADVTDNVSYQDFAAILSAAEFPRYFLPEDDSFSQPARTWYAGLPHGVKFILVHRAEWDF